MGEQNIMNSAEKSSGHEDHKDASEAFRLSLTQSDLVSDPTGGIKSNSQQTVEAMAQYKAGRYALVTAEGLSLLPSGIVNGVKHDWDNPGEFAVKMGTAALMGVGMRMVLPEAGAARALVGTAFTYFMARDAAMPVVNAWSQVSDRNDLANIHDAATKMSNGLGLFTVDLAAGLPIGLAADKLTGYGLNSTATGRAFEGWKENFFNSNNSVVGRFFNQAQDKADTTAASLADRTNKMADRLLGENGKAALSMEDKLRLIKEGGGSGNDHQHLSIEQKLDLIKENLDESHAAPKDLTPDAETAFKAYLEHKRWHKTEMQGKIDELIGDNTKGLPEVSSGPDAIVKGSSTLRSLRDSEGHGPEPTAGSGDKPSTPTGDKPTTVGDKPTAPAGDKPIEPGKPTDVTDKPAAPPARPLDRNADTVGQMSVTMRDLASKVSDVDKKIANFRESVQSPLSQTMRTGKPPLDEGHFGNNQALVELAGQIETPAHVKQAGFLLEHHRVANIQMGIPEQMPEIVDLNQYSRSVHKNLMDLLRKEGIDPGDVLRGTNSPVFLIFDSNGAGPYTIPAIKGVTDTAVIVLPREYQQMLGVHVSGVYSHELGHDLIYGDLLRFPDNLRDKVLRQDVVADAMKVKGIADTDIEVPGFDTMKKSEFFTKLLLAEANENTADIFGTAIDPNTPLSLATLLGSLRKPAAGAPEGARGQLETRSMYGTEFAKDASNPLGIEPHGIDAWRIKLGAEVLRQLSNNDAKVTAHAAVLDSMADQLRRPGDNYIWASMDHEGKFVSVPIKEWDAIIPGIVKAQLETPLPALNNKMLRDVYPDMTKSFPRVDGLAEQFAASARGNDKTVQGFNKTGHQIEDVYSAGLSGWMKAIAQNPEVGQPGYIAPEVLLERINGISKNLTTLYRNDNYLPPPPAVEPKPFNFASLITKPLGYLGRGLGSVVESEPTIRETFADLAPKAGIYAGIALTNDLFNNERRLQQIAEQQQLQQKKVQELQQKAGS